MAKKRISPRHNKRNDLTAKYLRSILDYNPKTGIFIWRWRNDVPKHTNTKLVGKPAGYLSCGYVRIKVNKKLYNGHRLAWLHFYGSWPKDEIDHKDLNRSNNKIKNLRDSDGYKNARNKAIQKNNTSGYKGVNYYPQYAKPFRATIGMDKKGIYLGYFKTIEEAHNAYCEASKKYHKEFSRPK